MKLLVLGGTAWLGRTVALTARDHGDVVTCLARGQSGTAPGGVRVVTADRDEPSGYDEVRGEDWDAVIDLARQPGHVRSAARALAECAAHAVFVSSISAYADHSRPGADESTPLLPALTQAVVPDPAAYGAAKVAGEQTVQTAFGPDRCLLVRAGLIGGPGDSSGRSGYWPTRFADPAGEDGAVLIPDAPDQPTQLIDVRDLAAWLRAAAAAGVPGAIDAVGPSMPLSRHLSIAAAVAGHSGGIVAADPEWLQRKDVMPWAGPRSLPLWLPGQAFAGFAARTGLAARAAGLQTRPLHETLADTLAWEAASGHRGPHGAGLTVDEERALLDAWASR